jgi:hypothetical protein
MSIENFYKLNFVICLSKNYYSLLPLIKAMLRDLKIDVMRLQAILESRATHSGDYDENEYQELRDKIISQENLKDYIPDFLFICRTLDQFWNHVKSPKFTTYDQRRTFLFNSFNPLLSYLEQKKGIQTIPVQKTIQTIPVQKTAIDKEKRIYEYEVALSFAGEEREYVRIVAEYLKNNGIKVFYDEEEEQQVKMWGKDLTEYLSQIYGKLSHYCVMFISENYAEKVWTRHEKRSALERAIKEKEEYILPARFDDTEIDGLPSTFHYIDLRNKTSEKFGEFILKKLNQDF